MTTGKHARDVIKSQKRRLQAQRAHIEALQAVIATRNQVIGDLDDRLRQIDRKDAFERLIPVPPFPGVKK